MTTSILFSCSESRVTSSEDSSCQRKEIKAHECTPEAIYGHIFRLFGYSSENLSPGKHQSFSNGGEREMFILPYQAIVLETFLFPQGGSLVGGGVTRTTLFNRNLPSSLFVKSSFESPSMELFSSCFSSCLIPSRVDTKMT